MITLPVCELTDLPRLFCGCRDHNDGFTLTGDEHRFLDSTETVSEMFTTGAHRHMVTASIGEYVPGSYGIAAAVKVANTDVRCGCGRTRDESVWICAQCVENLEVALGDVPALLQDLRVLAAKQARFAASGRGNDRSPLPFNPAAADGARSLAKEVMDAAWAEHKRLGMPLPALDGEIASRWLLANVGTVMLDPDGHNVVTRICREHRRALRAIDCPPETAYIGLCDHCRAPMHARGDEATHRCRDCQTEHSVADKISQQQRKVRESLLSLREIADLSASQLGGKITLKQLEGLVRRDVLKPAAHRPGNGRHERIALYRAADVVAIMDRRAS